MIKGKRQKAESKRGKGAKGQRDKGTKGQRDKVKRIKDEFRKKA